MDAKIYQIGFKNEAHLRNTEQVFYQVKYIPIAKLILCFSGILILILALYRIYQKLFKN